MIAIHFEAQKGKLANQVFAVIFLFGLQNEWQPNILDRLYQIMFKIIILSQIGADRYQKHIFEILLLSPPWSVVHWW